MIWSEWKRKRMASLCVLNTVNSVLSKWFPFVARYFMLRHTISGILTLRLWPISVGNEFIHIHRAPQHLKTIIICFRYCREYFFSACRLHLDKTFLLHLPHTVSYLFLQRRNAKNSCRILLHLRGKTFDYIDKILWKRYSVAWLLRCSSIGSG